MARFNEILVARYSKFLQKALGIKGHTPTPVLSSEIQAALAIFSGAENRFLEEWDRFGVSTSQSSVAASLAGVRIRNPKGSGVIAVIEKIASYSTTGVEQPSLQQGAVITDLTTILAPTRANFDPRGRNNPTCIVSSASPAAALATTKANMSLTSSSFGDFIVTDIDELPLLPGDAYQVVATVVNQNLNVTWWWRERSLEDSELF